VKNITHSAILSELFSSHAVAQIIDFFLDHKEFDYSPTEIAQKTGLSLKTIIREIPNLERFQLVKKSRKIGKTTMYILNTDLTAIQILEKFVLEMSEYNTAVEKPIDANIQTSDEIDKQQQSTMVKKFREKFFRF
jgi:DNA-binding IscR family transcriptional regulator